MLADVPVVAADATELGATTGLLASPDGVAAPRIGGFVAAGAGSGVGVATTRGARTGYGSGSGALAAARGTRLVPSSARSDSAIVTALGISRRRHAASGRVTVDRRRRDETGSLNEPPLSAELPLPLCPKATRCLQTSQRKIETSTARPLWRSGGRVMVRSLSRSIASPTSGPDHATARSTRHCLPRRPRTSRRPASCRRTAPGSSCARGSSR